MKIWITGAAGFLGRKLAQALAQRGSLRGRPIEQLTLSDLALPAAVQAPFDVRTMACDIADRAALHALSAQAPDVVFHLAAVVSGAAEADLDLGLRVNLHGTLHLLDAVRQAGNRPVLVFASSCAVHGGDEPDCVVDGVAANPQNSYGTQKVIGELLVQDASRRGLIDGRSLRLPTVSIRPGRPNAAASSFMSSIFREPLQGQPANCPVPRDFAVWHTAPRTVVANLLHGAELPGEAFGLNRTLDIPGRTDTIGEMIEAMTRVAGPDPAGLITWQPDPAVQRIVQGWRAHFRTGRALALGFQPDRSFEDSVRWFQEDDQTRA